MGHATSAAPLDDEKLSLDPTVAKNLTLPKAANKGADADFPDHDLGARILSEAVRTR